MAEHTVVLYHGHCADGFGAAWAAWTALGDRATYLPVQYGAPAPNVENFDTIYCVDCSYPRAVLEDWRNNGMRDRRVVVLDHHQTAQEALTELDYATFDMDKSGAMLAWEHFRPETAPPRLIGYVQDRDLWRWALPYSREVSAALWSYPMEFATWGALALRLESALGDVVAEGAAILRYMEQQTAMICDQARRQPVRVVAGWPAEVPIVNATNLWSEIGEELLRRFPDAPYAASYYDTQQGLRKWSLRSRGDFDVSEVARQHGGGGHNAAAGYEEPLPG